MSCLTPSPYRRMSFESSQLELTAQQPRCITLTPDQSKLLREASGGEPGNVFLVTAPATWPDDPETWRLWIVPSTASAVNKAMKSLHRAGKHSEPSEGKEPVGSQRKKRGNA